MKSVNELVMCCDRKSGPDCGGMRHTNHMSVSGRAGLSVWHTKRSCFSRSSAPDIFMVS